MSAPPPGGVFHPYSTIEPLFAAIPTWMGDYDAKRIASYQLYEQIYWTVPETFRLAQRGTDASPIYVPNARTIVETTNRYIGKGLSIVVDPDISTPVDQASLRGVLRDLFTRERFFAKWNASKRYGLIRGDFCFHLLANPSKLPGSRLRIEELDPAAYFPVEHPDDPDRLIAVHIVERIIEGDEEFIKRQTYTKGSDPEQNDGSDTTIYSSAGIFKLEDWEKALDLRVAERTIQPVTALPPQITALPVYHFRSGVETPGDRFGSSELRGFERIMAAVNQAISDEELTLALEGLGLYATKSGPPRDRAGNEIPWQLGPGRVVHQVEDFRRVNGVGSVTPYQDHLRFLIDSIKEASATPDAAIGKVDVAVAESGVSLRFQLGPMLDKAEEREQSLTDTGTQMLYDLRGWLAAYEGFVTAAYAYPSFGNKLPTDRAGQVKEILEIVAAQVASAEWGRVELGKLGYVFDASEGTLVETETAARASALDAWAARAGAELNLNGQSGT